MGACGRGAPDWTSKNCVQATVENAQRFPSGCGRALARGTSKRVHARGRRGSFHRPLRGWPPAPLGEGVRGRGDEETADQDAPGRAQSTWSIPGVPPFGTSQLALSRSRGL